jgi:DNA-binding response OmpR family regulator
MPLLISVLVVDPFPDDADLLATYLALKGVDVRVAPDARTATETAARSRPDALLVRLRQESPHFTGIDVVRACRSRRATRHLPIVVMATSIRGEDRARALEAGCDRYVLLPCPPQQLLDELVALIRPPATPSRRRSPINR